MSRPVVVIAEDEPHILKSIAFIVEREGGQPVEARDGASALAAVRRTPPVLAILDVMMPAPDGLEVTRQLRADPDFAELPIVVLTAMNEPDIERAAKEAGATYYLRKPFDPRALRELIVSYLKAG